jgi:hypothetical protein
VKLAFDESIEIGAPPDEVWNVLTDNDAMPLFSGFGPIPAIRSARWIQGDEYREGAVREVQNADGSSHREEVVTAVKARCLEDRIHDFTSPFRWLVREARDRFELVPNGDRTEMRRTFAIELTNLAWWPAAALLLPLLRRAVRRHNAALRTRLGV